MPGTYGPSISLGGVSTGGGPNTRPGVGSSSPGPSGSGGVGIRGLWHFKDGGTATAKAKTKKMAKGGKVSSASKRGDGIATKGKTKGRFV